MPIKNEVRVKNYSTPADSWAPNRGAQVTDTVENPNPAYNEDVQKVREGEKLDDVTLVNDDTTTDVTNNDIANEGAEVITDVDENNGENNNDVTVTIEDVVEEQQALDLAPYFTTSSWKSPGFAGSVALRVKNVGAERYWGEFPALTFRVEVKTEQGPKGVDRLITTTGANGTHIRDLGYNFKKQARIFEVTLSNPVNAGDDMLLGAFSFGDGKTKEGRLYNYMTVTQTGRLVGDHSQYNDQQVDSRENTRSDFGRVIKGTF